jgi:hypothetical protein
MFILSAWLPLWIVLSGATALASEVPHLIDGAELSSEDSAGPGSIYSWGFTGVVRLGSEDDLSNRSGDLHFNYTNQIAPENVTGPVDPLKHSTNWSGGTAINLWTGAFVGLDLESTSDPIEQLYSDALKVSLGQDPVRFSYRYSRNEIEFPLVISNRPYDGTFIYQHTAEVEVSLVNNDVDYFSVVGNYSFFFPNAQEFASLLSLPQLASLSNFQDTLDEFEQWSVGVNWTRHFGSKWDGTFAPRLAHLIIPGSPLEELVLNVGYKINNTFHVQIGADYTHDSLEHQIVFPLVIKASWDREPPPDNNLLAPLTID